MRNEEFSMPKVKIPEGGIEEVSERMKIAMELIEERIKNQKQFRISESN